MNKKFIILFSLFNLICCQTNQAKTNSTNNDNTNQVNISNLKTKYDFPLEFNIFYECEDKTEKIYRLDKDSNFEYFENNISIKFKLSDNDKKSLFDVLYKNDIYELNKKSEKIPPDAPQTEECRAISQISVTVQNKTNLFELNDRKLYHTKEYNEAFNNIKNKLDEFKNKYLKQITKEIILNEEISLNNEYKLKYLKLVEDSRCPENARCIWAGRVTIKFEIIKNNKIETEFELSIPEKDTFENSLFKIKLIDVSKNGKCVLQVFNK
ncbi:MAG: hypothetical protein KatS3mg068_1381 [Candidatus Sericytochromatia bacterium]|nr:MAG: hypothetical protein KatS3mg068_1381 [Candidatus Sericytochromatia bacterium]